MSAFLVLPAYRPHGSRTHHGQALPPPASQHAAVPVLASEAIAAPVEPSVAPLCPDDATPERIP